MKGLCMVPSTGHRYGLYSIDISIPCPRPQFPYLRNVFLPHTTTARIAVMCFVSQTCSTLCNPTDCSPPGSSVHGILQARMLEWLPCPPPGIVPTQGWNPGLPQADSSASESPGKPRNTGVGSLSLLQGVFPTQESNRRLRHCRWILHQLS